MKDLNIVIGSLGGCIRGICSNCEYGDSDCHRDELMKDAMEYLKAYYELLERNSWPCWECNYAQMVFRKYKQMLDPGSCDLHRYEDCPVLDGEVLE